jgi:hypothetical protein
MMALAQGATTEREVSWRDWSIPTDISGDGNTVLFDEQGVESGPTYTVAVRDMRGSPPIPLGLGKIGWSRKAAEFRVIRGFARQGFSGSNWR